MKEIPKGVVGAKNIPGIHPRIVRMMLIQKCLLPTPTCIATARGGKKIAFINIRVYKTTTPA